MSSGCASFVMMIWASIWTWDRAGKICGGEDQYLKPKEDGGYDLHKEGSNAMHPYMVSSFTFL